jgi:hypothetical protein
MAKNPIIKKQLVLEALENNLGLVSHTCKEVGISRNTFYVYYRTDPDFKLAVDDINEMVTDFVESQLYKKIKEGDTQSILFYMKYKGKKRGYSDSIDINSKVESTVKIIKLIGPSGGDTN